MKKSRHPGIEIMSDGRKRVRVRAVDPRTGRTKEVDRIFEGTVEAALKAKAEWRDEILNSDRVAREVPRLRDYVPSWLRSKALGVKTSTAMTYADSLAHYVLPFFGGFFIDRITDGDVRRWQVELRERLEAGTVNGALIMLRMVLADAVAEFQLAHNPAGRVRRLPLRKFTDEEPNLLTAEELGRVLSAFRSHQPERYPLAATLALTGLRYGEATALKWGDLDEASGLIRVKRAQWGGVVDTTKTGTVRSVPLVPELAAILREHRADLADRGLGDASGWVFPRKNGKLLPKSWLRWSMLSVLRELGIRKRVTIHGLRRTFNNLSRQVAGEIVTRSITGHVTQAMTEHYSHVGQEEKLAAAESVVRLVLKAPDPSPSAEPSGGKSGGSSTSPSVETRHFGPNLPN